MPSLEVKVRGGEQFIALGRRLKEAGEGGLQKELKAAINRAAKPAQEAVREAVPQYMPKRGGYAAELRAALRLRTAQVAAGVKITAYGAGKAKRRALPALEGGVLRHPVFGRHRHSRRRGTISNPWVAQVVRPGFFKGPIEEHADDIRRELIDAMDRVANKIKG